MGTAQNDNLSASPAMRQLEESMYCSECKNLYRTFEGTLARFVEARTSAFYQVSTRIAVRKHVDLVRAKNDLCEHQEVCPWAILAQHFGQHGIVQFAEA